LRGFLFAQSQLRLHPRGLIRSAFPSIRGFLYSSHFPITWKSDEENKRIKKTAADNGLMFNPREYRGRWMTKVSMFDG
jgi:hypothetical protein